jgi:hypothetical protein
MSYQATPLSGAISLEDQTYHQAKDRVAEVWYESDWLTTVLYYVLAIPLFAVFWWLYRLSPPPFWSLIGMTVYGAGWGVDTFTTWQCLRLMPVYQMRGIPYPLKERSLFMGEETGLMRQLLNAGTLYSLLVFLASWIAPALGIAGGLAHMGAAINNRRKWRRLLAQLEIVDGKQNIGTQTRGKGQKHTESQE